MKKTIWILLICLATLTFCLMLGCTIPGATEPTEQETQAKPTEDPAEQETTPNDPNEDPSDEPSQEETKPEMTLEERIESLRGKYVSILGDSISTYQGVSNVGTTNTTIAGYNAWYNGDWKNVLSSTDETYWGMVMSKYQMKLLVNNSCGGSRLIDASGTGGVLPAGYLRVENLAANTGELNGTKPDIIFCYMGTNDCNAGKPLGELTEDTFDSVIRGDSYITPTTFTEAYIITLDKATKLYPDAQIFVFTLPHTRTSNRANLNAYNARIHQLATYYENVVLVDIAAYSGITPQNFNEFTFDGIHPNQKGFAAIADDLEKALLNIPY